MHVAHSIYIQPLGETFQPKPFQYQYGVAGPAIFDKTEQQDSSGNVEGRFSVKLPDGRLMIVNYNADHHDG